jgi:thiol-disulfide isomerase/thioredoxin
MQMLYALMLCPLLSLAQPTTPKPLTIGDRVPDLHLTGIHQYESKEACLSTLSGKLLIIDFWSSWCSMCIASFPKLDTLQQKFKGSLQFLLVNDRSSGDDLKKAHSMFERMRLKSGLPLQLPFLVQDTVLSNYFPSKSIPHCVWIMDGEVKAITSYKEVDEHNIQAMLKGENVKLRLKKDLLTFDRNKSLLENFYNELPPLLRYQSILTSRIDGVSAGSGFLNTGGNTVRLYQLNATITDLYQYASGISYKKRLLLQVKDSSRFMSGKVPGDEWRIDNTYCIEVTAPAGTTYEEMKHWMIEDLNRAFRMHGRFEKRTISCLALIKLNKNSEVAPAPELNSYTGKLSFYCNRPMSSFVHGLNIALEQAPLIVDETGITGNVNLELRTSLSNLDGVKRELKRYNLELVAVEREVDMFILSERKGPEETAVIKTNARKG